MTATAAVDADPAQRLRRGVRIVVVSHKECWVDDGVVHSTGGFPAQMGSVAALASLRLVAPVVDGPRPGGVAIDAARGVAALPVLQGTGWRRRLRTVVWIVRMLPILVREVRSADLVYSLVPGDVGSVGMLVAAALRRPLVVRHCGTWGRNATRADRLTDRVLRWLSRRHVVLATGWSAEAPSPAAPRVRWIFSSSYRSEQFEHLGRARTLPSGRRRLATAGRQVPQKGTAVAIGAVAALRADGYDVSLTVLGDGPALDTFRDEADRLGVADVVDFRGRVSNPDVMAGFAASDLFVFPTTSNEGFPKVVVEAMACGLPVVSTAVSALATIVPGAGRLIDRAEPSVLAAAVAELLDDPDQYAEASSGARRRAAGFTVDGWQRRFVEAVVETYPDLAEAPGAD